MRKQELKMKDIDLLKSYQKNNDVKEHAPWLKYAIPPIVLALVLGGVFGFVTFQNSQLKTDIASANDEILKIKENRMTNPDALTYQEIQDTKTATKYYKDLYDKVASYPTLQTGIFDAIANSAYGTIQVTSLSYARESQVITLQIETSVADGAETVVRRLKNTGVFQAVSYAGYTRTQKNSTSTSEETSTSQMTTEQLLEYLTKGTTTPSQNQTQTNTNSTYDVYTATVLCMLK